MNEDIRAAPRLLVRLSGGGAMMGGVLFLVWGYVHRPDLPLYLKAVVAVVSFAAPMLFLTALIGLYACCHEEVGRLGKTGVALGIVGSALGVARSVVDVAVPTLYPLDVLSGRILLLLGGVWTGVQFVGLLVVGGALLVRTGPGAGALRALGALLLAMGASGWAYSFTDSGAIFEDRAVHIWFGILFGLGWVALGVALQTGGVLGAKEPQA